MPRAPFPACGSCDEVASKAGRPPVNPNRKLRRRRRALGARDGVSVPVTPVDEALEELILVSGFFERCLHGLDWVGDGPRPRIGVYGACQKPAPTVGRSGSSAAPTCSIIPPFWDWRA
jgi:hypothetical protein